jgi:uncharacterized protein YkwD
MMLRRSAAPRRVLALALAVLVWADVVAPAPARAVPDTAAAVEASVFCPRPTGRWWEDAAAHGCAQLLSGRDMTAPLGHRELGWLDLGALPAFATVDLEALTEELTAHAARMAAEAAAREAREEEARRATARPAPSRRVRQPLPTFEQVEQMMAECGLSFDDDHGPLGEHPCIAAAWARIVADMPVFEAPSGPGFPALRPDWHDVMMTAVNGERAARGVRRVTSCPSLTRTAQAYAEVLRDWGRISHTGPDGSTPFERAVAGGYSIRIEPAPGFIMVDGMVAENLAAGHSSVPEVVHGWMNSPGHRANLLGGQWTEAGFGLARAGSASDTYGYYWVQLFGDGTGNC